MREVAHAPEQPPGDARRSARAPRETICSNSAIV